MPKAKGIGGRSQVSTHLRRSKTGKTARVKTHTRSTSGKTAKVKIGSKTASKIKALHLPKTSSFIKGASYNSGKKELTINLGGKVYRYFNVSQGIVKRFKEAESQGKFFHKNIRNLKFKKLN